MLNFCLRECEYKRKTVSIKRSRRLNESRYSNHLKMSERLYDHIFLFLRCLRRPAVLTLRQVIVLPLNDPAFPLCLRDIQMCHMESILLLHPHLDLFVCSSLPEPGHVHIFQIEFHADLLARYVSLGSLHRNRCLKSLQTPVFFRI